MKDIIQLAEAIVEQYGKDAHCTGYAQAEDCPVEAMAVEISKLRTECARLQYLTRGDGEPMPEIPAVTAKGNWFVEGQPPLRLMTRDGMEDAK